MQESQRNKITRYKGDTYMEDFENKVLSDGVGEFIELIDESENTNIEGDCGKNAKKKRLKKEKAPKKEKAFKKEKVSKKDKALKQEKQPKQEGVIKTKKEKRPKNARAKQINKKNAIDIKNYVKSGLSIKVKLIGAFTIPVLLIILLGTISYNTATNAITSSYTESSVSTVKKTADYYTLMFSNIKSTASEFASSSDVKSYYSGSFSADPITEESRYNSIFNSLNATVMGNSAIKTIHVISNYGKSIFTTTNLMEVTGEYEKVKASEEGKQIDSKRSAWFTSRSYIDTKGVGKYSVSYGRQLLAAGKGIAAYRFQPASCHYCL